MDQPNQQQQQQQQQYQQDSSQSTIENRLKQNEMADINQHSTSSSFMENLIISDYDQPQQQLQPADDVASSSVSMNQDNHSVEDLATFPTEDQAVDGQEQGYNFQSAATTSAATLTNVGGDFQLQESYGDAVIDAEHGGDQPIGKLNSMSNNVRRPRLSASDNKRSVRDRFTMFQIRAATISSSSSEQGNSQALQVSSAYSSPHNMTRESAPTTATTENNVSKDSQQQQTDLKMQSADHAKARQHQRRVTENAQHINNSELAAAVSLSSHDSLPSPGGMAFLQNSYATLKRQHKKRTSNATSFSSAATLGSSMTLKLASLKDAFIQGLSGTDSVHGSTGDLSGAAGGSSSNNNNDTLMRTNTYDSTGGGAADDEDNDSINLSLTGQSATSIVLRSVQVYIGDSKVAVVVRCFSGTAAVELIRTAIEENQGAANQFADGNYQNYRLYKLDRNVLVARFAVALDQSLDQNRINDGDELRLKWNDEIDCFKLTVPPSKQVQVVKFGMDDVIKSIVAEQVKTASQQGLFGGEALDHNQSKVGLYYRKLGIWLDDKKPLSSYEIDSEHVLELRVISREFLLRIQIPEIDTKFTVKVLPSLETEDVLAMVRYNLRTRKLSFEGSSTYESQFYNVTKQKSSSSNTKTKSVSGRKYGLWLPSRQVWMALDKQLDDYGLHSAAEEVQYKLRQQTLLVAIPSYLKMTSEFIKHDQSPTDFKQEDSRFIKILASESQTVKDIVELLNLQNSQATEWSTALQVDIKTVFALYTGGSERLKDESTVWSILKQLSSVEFLEYRMVPRRLSVTCTDDIEVRLDLDIDLSKPLHLVMPLIWRRFGVDNQMTFQSIRVMGTKNDLSMQSSLLDQDIRPGCTLLMNVALSGDVKDVAQKQSDSNNIWEEGADSSDNLVVSNNGDGTVTAATLNKLIEKLTDADNGDPNQYMDFMKTFLLTYQSFTSSNIFLQKLIERYHVPRMKRKIATFQDFDKFRLKIQLRVCNVIQQWTKKYTYDFVDAFAPVVNSEKAQAASLAKHHLLLEVLKFAENVVVEDQPTLSRQIRKNGLRLRDGTWENQLVVTTHTEPPPPPKFNLNVKASAVNPFACEPEEIARQLTIIEFQLFANIMPYEFLNQSWTKADADQRAPGIIAVTKRFNEVAYWVAKSIVEIKTIRGRVKRMSKLVDIAGHLYAMHNYSTLMAFVAGFNKAPVTRLKHTAKDLSARTTKKLVDLEAIMSAESSYKIYRAKIHTANPPCIPYLGVYLLDLTYMEDGNPNRIGQLINFAKRKLIYILIREMQQYQDKPFNLKLVPEISDSLKHALAARHGPDGQDLSMKAQEDFLFQQSLEREPRNADRSTIE